MPERLRQGKRGRCKRVEKAYMTMTTQLRFTDLTIGYADKTIQRNLSADLLPGQLTCLIGRNGIGKSTLLRTLTGFQRQLGGQIEVGGKDASMLSRQDFAKLVSVVLTSRPDAEQITVMETVALGRAPYTNMWGTLSEADRRIVDDCLQAVGMSAFALRRLHTLSDGECQKVMIARALAQQTPVIILDEPTAFLDYPSRVEMLALLSRLAHEGRSILLSTHDLELTMRMADTLWVMRPSTGLEVTTPSKLSPDGPEAMSATELCALLS